MGDEKLGASVRRTWWRIEAPHFVAGLCVMQGRVVEAAPIVQWAIGRRWHDVRAYMVRRGWHGSAS